MNDVLTILTCFNSMIVRLKEMYMKMLVRNMLFQFYDSPIKSFRIYLKNFLMKKFQFYDSPIKRKMI